MRTIQGITVLAFFWPNFSTKLPLWCMFFTDLEAATLASQTTTTKSSSYAESKSSGQRLFSSGGRGFESMTSANSHQIAAAAQIGQHRLLQNGAGK